MMNLLQDYINPFLKQTLWHRLQQQLCHLRMFWKTITILTWLIKIQEVEHSVSQSIFREDQALQTSLDLLDFLLVIIIMWAIMNHLWTQVQSKRRKINWKASILTQIIQDTNLIERRPYQSPKRPYKTILLLVCLWKRIILKISY